LPEERDELDVWDRYPIDPQINEVHLSGVIRNPVFTMNGQWKICNFELHTREMKKGSGQVWKLKYPCRTFGSTAQWMENKIPEGTICLCRGRLGQYKGELQITMEQLKLLTIPVDQGDKEGRLRAAEATPKVSPAASDTDIDDDIPF